MILRVLIAASHPDLFASDHWIRDEDVLLSAVSSDDEMWGALRTEPFDLLVVDREHLGSDPGETFERLLDLPDAPDAIVLAEGDDPERRAELLNAGALACISSSIERPTLYRTIRALLRRTRRAAQQSLIADEAARESYLSDFASKSPSMRTFLATVRKIVDASSSLLILGETGVGKEYLARAIHAEGRRKDQPFVAVNCAALPEALLESELFGHVAGAFTGAQKARRGYFELAHGGTLFLDEIAELPTHLQVKLLRVLQDRSVQPVGAEKSIEVDVRLIAATNRDLKEEMEARRFRSDLYYRIGVISLTVPALRERREDLPDLLQSHVEHFRRTLGRLVLGIEPEALDLLMRYDWPGNVRELINVVERAVLLAEHDEIRAADLPEEVRAACDPDRALPVEIPDAPRLIETPLQEARDSLVRSFETRYLDELLRATQGRIGEAAQRAGITQRALYEKMKRHGLRKESFKPRAAPRP